MATKGSEIQELITQVALLTQEVKNLSNSVDKAVSDHEGRLRNLETGQSSLKQDVSTIRERMTIFNLLQGTLAMVAAGLAYWFKK